MHDVATLRKDIERRLGASFKYETESGRQYGSVMDFLEAAIGDAERAKAAGDLTSARRFLKLSRRVGRAARYVLTHRRERVGNV